MNLGVWLLLMCVLKHFGYKVADDDSQALLWNALGSLTTMSLLAIVWAKNKSPVVGLVVLWWLYEETLVVGCSLWRLVDWWPLAEGEDQCTARMGSKLASISLVIVGACIARVSSERRRCE